MHVELLLFNHCEQYWVKEISQCIQFLEFFFYNFSQWHGKPMAQATSGAAPQIQPLWTMGK